MSMIRFGLSWVCVLERVFGFCWGCLGEKM